ncbi:MAG: glycosyltransferase [Gammaproteobacteria bacterium]|nr:glycosyltransferase [Gammaproteobacteria bacterium]
MINTKEKVAIISGSIHQGDAVGHDVCMMYQTLEKLEYHVSLLALGFNANLEQQYDCIKIQQISSLNDYDIVIYHHAFYFPQINKLLKNFIGKLMIRYHNVTPSHFYMPYKKQSPAAYFCEMGRQQIANMVNKFNQSAYWIADSNYNSQELIDWGVNAQSEKIAVCPPFMNLNQKVRTDSNHINNDSSNKSVNVIFVGRFVPNKAHKEMIKVIYAYKQCIDENIILTLIGSHDPLLQQYDIEVQQLIDELKLNEQVQIKSFVSNEELQQHYQQADVYLCMSHHEGFCVPIVEAQAMGLPIVTTNTAAIGETLGTNQMSSSQPSQLSDYVYFAKMIQQLVVNQTLKQAVIDQGYQNVAGRFAADIVEQSFVEIFYRFALADKMNNA